MIKHYNGAKAEKAVTSEKLPAGAYVAQIMGAEVAEYDWGSKLIISFDIAEGDYRGFFAADWKNNTNPDRKWRGVYRATIPDEGSEWFNSQKRTFNGIMYALENSNSGYTFDWDESKLKGLKIGVVFGEREWEYNGNTGWTTECRFLADVDSVRADKIKLPKPKPLSNGNSQSSYTGSSNQSQTASSADYSALDDDLPF